MTLGRRRLLTHSLRSQSVDGLLSVMVYTGHEGGAAEAAVVESFCAALPARSWTCTKHALLNRRDAPYLVLAYRTAI